MVYYNPTIYLLNLPSLKIKIKLNKGTPNKKKKLIRVLYFRVNLSF